MKVKELIEKLKEFNPDSEIWVDPESNYIQRIIDFKELKEDFCESMKNYMNKGDLVIVCDSYREN
jgi:hypothetical protein